MRLKLDIGCGYLPTGDVNLDRGPMMVNVHEILATKANIYGDAHFLPFKDKAFDEVYSSHCLEHLDSPIRAIREFERVGKYVKIRVPHKYHVSNRSNKAHKWSFTDTWFRKLGYHAEATWVYHRLLFIAIPRLNEVIAEKRESCLLSTRTCGSGVCVPLRLCEPSR